MLRTGKTVLALLLATSALVLACGESQAPPEDDDTTAASEATRREIGVDRWSTKNAPASIEGYDENGEVVVSLRHRFASVATGEMHAFELREHANVAVTQFAIEKNEQGGTTFVLLQDLGNASVARVLERMKADLEGEVALATTSVGSVLQPKDVPWTTPSVQLICGKADLMNGADTCMNHHSSAPQEAKSWAVACSAYVQANPGATRDDTACKQVGVNPCSCTDLTRVSRYTSDMKQVCTYTFEGVGILERPAGCSDPKFTCPKQNATCVATEIYCSTNAC